MKTLFTFIISLCFSMILQAQVSKTVEVTSGNLTSLLSEEEKNTVTNLTLTGTIDARDFKTLRDSMPMLAVLDIREVDIIAFSGYYGTLHFGNIYDTYQIYPADEIPGASFLDKVTFESIVFPLSCNSIGSSVFSGSGLKGELHLPSTISYIGHGAFYFCTGLTGDLVIPPLVTKIEGHTFNHCSGFTSLTLPPSIREIGYDAFNSCSGLQYIDAQSPTPIQLNSELLVFDNINKTTCELRVPYGTRELYASAPVWKEFTNIVEHEQGLLVSASSLHFEKEEETDNSIHLKANVDWSVSSDQTWLSVSPASGNSDQIISITVEANPTIAGRQGTITISSEGIYSQQIHVTQNGVPNILSITPGGLESALTAEEKSVMSHLILTGTMDARDFRTISNQMPLLKILDISGATIVAFTDTTYGNHINHQANAIPFAIHEWNDNFKTDYSLSEHPNLTVVKLPATLTTIPYRAFYACNSLTTVEMQSSVNYIGTEAFLDCSSLTSIDLPSTINYIGESAFEWCSSLTSIDLPSELTIIHPYTFSECSSLRSINIPVTVTELGGYAFYGCSELQSIVIPPLVTAINGAVFSNCSSLATVVMPTNLTEIKHDAFYHCISLTSITIPKTVTRIGNQAFNGCTNLQSIYSYPDHPVNLLYSDSWGVFDEIDKSSCILYVPYGSIELYANSYGWKDFLNIVEMGEFNLSPASLTIEPAQQSVAVELTTVLEWTVSSDQSWLTVTPASGSGNTTFTLSAETNPTVEDRTATVMFQTNAGTTPSILVTQRGIHVSVEVTAGNLSAAFPNAEQRTVNHLTLTGTMDARDFKFIRDQLPIVTELDLSGVTIVAYAGNEGTYLTQYHEEGYYEYPANEIPTSAFEGYASDVKINFPSNVTSIGAKAFYYCSKLTELTIPSSVTFIGEAAFAGCYNMIGIVLPPTITRIENSLFMWCSSLPSITIPSTVTSIGAYAFSSCLKLTYLEVPNSVTSIGRNAFEICYDLQTVILPAALDTIKEETFYSSGLTSLRIPASVKYIGKDAFTASHSLTTFYADPVNPPELPADRVFNITDQSYSTLYVPYGSKEKYAAADQWKDFFNIIEKGAFELSYTELTIGASPTVQPIDITTEGLWTVVIDKEWVTVNPASGNSSQTININVLENTAFKDRIATITFTAANSNSQTVTVTQQAKINSIPVANAGADQSIEEGETVQLDSSASMDADNDTLSYEWSAPEGITLSSTSEAKPTFMAPKVMKDTVLTFVLMVSDGKENSQSDEVLVTITNKIVELGVSTNAVSFESKESSANITVTGNAQWTATGDKDWLSITPSSGEGEQDITLTAQANVTFTQRMSTVIVSAPEADQIVITVTQQSRINSMPIAYAGEDQSVEEGETVQLDGTASMDAENDALIYIWSAPVGITLSTASGGKPTFMAPKVKNDTVLTFVLMVSDGKENSQSDEVQITITNKMIELGVSTNTVSFESKESYAKIIVTGNAQWTATCDKDWLMVDPSAGDGVKIITLSAQANDIHSERVAIITVAAPEVTAKTITVTQRGLITGIKEMINPIEIKYYPNPFTYEMSIEVANEASGNASVEIYNLSGQRVKRLAKALNEAKITLIWDGTNEQGHQVPEGVYILKVNEAAWQVVKKK